MDIELCSVGIAARIPLLLLIGGKLDDGSLSNLFFSDSHFLLHVLISYRSRETIRLNVMFSISRNFYKVILLAHLS